MENELLILTKSYLSLIIRESGGGGGGAHYQSQL